MKTIKRFFLKHKIYFIILLIILILSHVIFFSGLNKYILEEHVLPGYDWKSALGFLQGVLIGIFVFTFIPYIIIRTIVEKLTTNPSIIKISTIILCIILFGIIFIAIIKGK